MKVYRVEDENKEGPYINKMFSCRDWSENTDIHWDKDTHPTRGVDMFLYKLHDRDDLNSYELDDFICAFDSMEQLNEWFTEQEIEDLNEYGFNIVKYDIDDKYILEGNSKKQIMFLPSEKIK